MGKGSSKVGGGRGSFSSRISSAATLGQAKRIAEKMGIHLDSSVLRDIGDERLVQDGLAEMAWAKEEFPILKNESITLKSDPSYKGAYMYSDSSSGVIAYAGMDRDNTVVRQNSYRLQTGLKDRNGLTDSPQGTEFKHVATHEMGHQVVRTACDQVMKEISGGKATKSSLKTQTAYSDYIVNKAFNSIPKSERGRKGLAGLQKQISKYAHSGGKNETVAEAIADYRANGSKAKPLSKAIYNTLKEETSAAGIKRFADMVK